MSALLVILPIAAYLAVAYVTFRLVRVWEFRDWERRYPGLYADEDYRRKSWGEWGWAALCAATWPIGLPLAAALTHQGQEPRAPRSEPPPRIAHERQEQR